MNRRASPASSLVWIVLFLAACRTAPPQDRQPAPGNESGQDSEKKQAAVPDDEDSEIQVSAEGEGDKPPLQSVPAGGSTTIDNGVVQAIDKQLLRLDCKGEGQARLQIYVSDGFAPEQTAEQKTAVTLLLTGGKAPQLLASIPSRAAKNSDEEWTFSAAFRVSEGVGSFDITESGGEVVFPNQAEQAFADCKATSLKGP